MASWLDIKTHVRDRYDAIEGADASIEVRFEILPGRIRHVTLTLQTLLAGREDWVTIEAPFGELGEIDLMEAARRVSEMVCGGIGTLDGSYATVRHAVRLAEVDLEGFDRLFHLTVGAADVLAAAELVA